MNQHIAVLFCIILCAILCTPAFCAEEKPPEVTVKGPGFHFTVALTRSTYLEGEPVLAKCSITNDLDRTQELAETCSLWRTLSWDVVRLPERDGMFDAGSRFPLLAPVPSQFVWPFKQGETKSEDIDVLSRTDGVLTAGDYAVNFTYQVPEHVRADWVGQLTTQEIVFRVERPQGKEAQLLNAIDSVQLTDDKQQLRRCAERLDRLARENPDSRFVVALEYRAAMERLMFCSNGCEWALKVFVTKHSDIAYYGPRASKELGFAYLRNHRWSDARNAFSLLPAGSTRQRYLS